jgi:hypothetical protein
MSNKIHVVQTLVDGLDSDGNSDTMPGQIIGCFDDKKTVNDIVDRLHKRKPIKGINYKNLPDFVDVAVMTFTLNKTIKT